MTNLENGGPSNRISVPSRVKRFQLCSKASRPDVEPTQWVTGVASLLGLKQAAGDADHTPPPGAEIKTEKNVYLHFFMFRSRLHGAIFSLISILASLRNCDHHLTSDSNRVPLKQIHTVSTTLMCTVVSD